VIYITPKITQRLGSNRQINVILRCFTSIHEHHSHSRILNKIYAIAQNPAQVCHSPIQRTCSYMQDRVQIQKRVKETCFLRFVMFIQYVRKSVHR